MAVKKKVAKKKVAKKAKAPKKKIVKKKAVKKVSKKAVKKIVKKHVKKAVKKTAKKPAVKMAEKKIEMKEAGKVSHFFDGISVAVIEVKGHLKLGNKIRIKGATTDFEQTVTSMQIDRKNIIEAKSGDRIGLKVREKVHDNDKVYVID